MKAAPLTVNHEGLEVALPTICYSICTLELRLKLELTQGEKFAKVVKRQSREEGCVEKKRLGPNV